ncbi:MAG: hypothetical protein RMX65_028040 [Nostoc sp. DedQUE01]|nr:hypothetical protein [Nostoc sp. DedQUE01]
MWDGRLARPVGAFRSTPQENLLHYFSLATPVGWVVACFRVALPSRRVMVRSETQQTPKNVGFRSSTQPTQFKVFVSNSTVLRYECVSPNFAIISAITHKLFLNLS